MAAFLLVVAAVLSRVLPHPWMNFTAVGGSLLYFGARRPLRQMWIPVLALAATDFYLTVFFYGYAFRMSDYLLTWAWYGAVIVLGYILLARKTSAARVGAGVLIAPTSFFLITNFAVWFAMPQIYPRSLGGLGLSYAAGLPFYQNDLLSTTIVAGLAFGLPAMARMLAQYRQQPASI
ncbi:MAG TPA: DUF6580 family putative transport protein [Acidobacteriaceae bacterium]|nr:DUF6580 family putative transport protein [Acidobacteriaceae bacterium]